MNLLCRYGSEHGLQACHYLPHGPPGPDLLVKTPIDDLARRPTVQRSQISLHSLPDHPSALSCVSAAAEEPSVTSLSDY